MKFFIVCLEDGEVRGTDSKEEALQVAGHESYVVVDVKAEAIMLEGSSAPIRSTSED